MDTSQNEPVMTLLSITGFWLLVGTEMNEGVGTTNYNPLMMQPVVMAQPGMAAYQHLVPPYQAPGIIVFNLK